jgi:hypothetical protein
MLQFRGWTNQGVLENTIVIHEEEEKEFCSGTVKMDVFLEFQSLVLMLTSSQVVSLTW